MEMNLYQVAWQRLLERIEQKTSWGKTELKNLMLECLVDSAKSTPSTLNPPWSTVDTIKRLHREREDE